ncbi:hypothetical protein AB0C42_33690, partial [Micromonospora taraxaci]|uniref:hypothetical protein n=1 Tax=Micromonospora taraxaci TaxID=1316803 RepID=UPI0033E8E372
LDAVVALAGYEASGGALTGQLDTHDTRAALQLVGPHGMEAATWDARRLLMAHRPALLRVAGALFDAGRLTGAQVVDLVRAVPMG